MLDLLQKYDKALLDGLAVTLKLCLIAWCSGIFAGTTVGIVVANSNKKLQAIARGIYTAIFACPLLVILYWFHFPFQKMFGLVIDPIYTAAFALSIVNIAGIANIIQEAIVKFPTQYRNSAYVCGVGGWLYFRKIQLPIITKRVFPATLLLQVNVVHASLFASMIAVPEIFRVAQRINAIEHQSVAIYTLMAVFFCALLIPAILVANKAKQWVDYNESEA